MIGGLRWLGLTGGIASGKSTVAQMFRALGVPVVDADELAREVLKPGTDGLREIAAEWPDVIAHDGQLDRARLSAKVFSDAVARRRLEAITHPRIAGLAQTRAQALAKAGARLALYDAALLVETGRHREFDGLIVVTAPVDEQVRRLRLRSGLDEEAARARIAAQLPLSEKIATADYVIDNGGPIAKTERQVEELARRLGVS